ncbi:MAG: hypothetical protein EBZ69_00275 [Alphaproteobacteria bacterium]|nr:hypothetical protein [Alphaproteobacteria bacterium]
MSNVFYKVAEVHRARLAKKEKIRTNNKRALGRAVAYFKDSGIPEMWETVKDIKVRNPSLEQVEGLVVPFSDLVDILDDKTATGTGLTVYDGEDRYSWYVEASLESDGEKESLYYRLDSPSKNFSYMVEEAQAKQKFVDSFIKWLSRHITPQMLAEMDPELLAPPTSAACGPRRRKFVQVAENE